MLIGQEWSKYVVVEDQDRRLRLAPHRSWWIVWAALAVFASPLFVFLFIEDDVPVAGKGMALLVAMPFFAWPFTWRTITFEGAARRVCISRFFFRRSFSFDDVEKVAPSYRVKRGRDPDGGDQYSFPLHGLFLHIRDRRLILVNEWTERKAMDQMEQKLKRLGGFAP